MSRVERIRGRLARDPPCPIGIYDANGYCGNELECREWSSDDIRRHERCSERETAEVRGAAGTSAQMSFAEPVDGVEDLSLAKGESWGGGLECYSVTRQD